MGATNVLRIAGKKAAALAAALDVVKGVLAVVFGGLIMGDGAIIIGQITLGGLSAQSMAAFAAVVGHVWPVFVKFRGGRGVATFMGGLLTLYLPAALFGGVVMLVAAGITRYASLGSIAGLAGTFFILVPLTIIYGLPLEYIVYTFAGAVLIIIMHRDNINRLMAGNERKIGGKIKKENLPTVD
jgi:glycerol-3-phosphate acyltransferase PlsY